MTLEELNNTYGSPLTGRDIGGITVQMFFNPSYDRDDVRIYYCDVKTETSFVLNPARFLAVEAYKHPIYYYRAECNGISNPDNLVPANIPAYAHAA